MRQSDRFDAGRVRRSHFAPGSPGHPVWVKTHARIGPSMSVTHRFPRIAKNADGKIDIVKKHEEPTRHGAAHGLGWGLAAGAVVALFPAVGIVGALAAGGGAGAAIGAVAGHVSGGMNRDDLKQLGEVLDDGQAGLIVVYAANMADQVAANIKAANRLAAAETDMAADELAREIKAAQAA